MGKNLLKENLKKDRNFIIDFSKANSFEEMYNVSQKYIKGYSKEQLHNDIDGIINPKKKLHINELSSVSGGTMHQDTATFKGSDILNSAGISF